MAGEIKRISEKYTKTITNVRENMGIWEHDGRLYVLIYVNIYVTYVIASSYNVIEIY